VTNDNKKSADNHPTKAPVQPTSEQLMIAQLIGGAEDPKTQHHKIQQVMDITGKEEDEVATALFDAGWDQNRAVELLLEGTSSHGAWEETGKKKKKQKQAAEEKVTNGALMCAVTVASFAFPRLIFF
jgi:hypothetical protein